MLLLLKNSVGKKILMAVTGQLMVLFVVIHMIGNSTIYFGWLNAYSKHLHNLWPLLWVFRLFMFSVVSLHVFFGITLYLENRIAKPDPYALRKNLRATFASKNMIWTGLLIAAFLMYHLLHFTIQVINPEASASANMDTTGRPDVLRMVILNFQNLSLDFIYIISMIALFLHLSHGIQSSFQTLGLSSDRTLPGIIKAGAIAAVVLLAGYVSIPILIFIGILKG
jgi:succinate dehydrogenase / fumarate reductase cytochrome b subunit